MKKILVLAVLTLLLSSCVPGLGPEAGPPCYYTGHGACFNRQSSLTSTEYMAHVEGNLWRSSRQSDLNKLLKFGKIINLEGNNEYVEQERAFAKAHGIIWHHYAMSESPFVKPSVATLLAIEADIEADPDIPTDVHCRRGKDRTGLVIGDYRIIKDHWPPAAAYEEMKAYGHAWWFYPTWRSVLDKIARRVSK